MLLDKIILYIILGVIELLFFYTVTIFYFNSKQNRKHERDIIERELKAAELENSVKENEQIKELLMMLKDYYK